MAIDINGAILRTSNTALNITTNSILGLDVSSAGFPTQSKKPFFFATDNGAWYNYPVGGWTNIVLNTPIIDNTNSYDKTTGRFTAPVSGTYAFQASTYAAKNTATNPDSYVHPIFRINDSYNAKQATSSTPYRLRMRTYYTGGYSGDTQINDIFYLTAGDYVNFHNYSSSSLQWYGAESFFSGYLIG